MSHVRHVAFLAATAVALGLGVAHAGPDAGPATLPIAGVVRDEQGRPVPAVWIEREGYRPAWGGPPAWRTDVHGRFLALNTAYRSIAVQGASRDAAREQLRLAQDRYRLGSGTALELSDAQNQVQQAEGEYINAVYGYHIAIAALEAAVGRPLR